MRVIDCVQGSEFWFNCRRGIPTASRFDQIIQPAKGELSKSCNTLICELIAELCTPGSIMPTGYISPAMIAGQSLEPEARRYLEFELNLDVRQVGFILNDKGTAGSSPDGLIGDHSGIEMKCPELKTHIAYLLDGKLPRDYFPQVHGSMVVSGRKEWVFMSYAAGMDPLIVNILWDSYTDKLAACLEEFDVLYRAAKAKIRIPERNR